MELNARGARLWASLTTQDASLEVESNPVRETAISACRAADRLDALEVLAAVTDVVFEGRSGPMTHPVHVEVRQAAALVARLIAALRLPDKATGAKPQKRQARGVYQTSAVSSLDRARAAKSG